MGSQGVGRVLGYQDHPELPGYRYPTRVQALWRSRTVLTGPGGFKMEISLGNGNPGTASSWALCRYSGFLRNESLRLKLGTQSDQMAGNSLGSSSVCPPLHQEWGQCPL